MVKKILKILYYICMTLLVLIGIYHLTNGGITNIIETTKQYGFFKNFEDLFVGIFKGLAETLGL